MKEKTLTIIRALKEKVGNKLPLVVLGVFIMIYAGIFMAYSQDQSDADNLESEIALKETILKNPGPDLTTLREELGQAEETLANTSKLAEEMIDLPDSAQTIELYEALVKLAKHDHVELLNITGSLAAESSENSAILPVMLYSLSVQGDYDNLLGFISDIAENPDLLKGVDFGSITIQNSGSSDSPSSLSLELSVYVLPEPASEN